MDELGSYSFEAGTRDKMTLQGQRCSEVKDHIRPGKQLCNKYTSNDLCSLFTQPGILPAASQKDAHRFSKVAQLTLHHFKQKENYLLVHFYFTSI